MTTLTQAPQRISNPLLDVRREDIRFWNLDPERLAIEITVHNRGRLRSWPTPLTVEAAPLGAFVPTQFVETVEIPEIEPGEDVTLRLEATLPPRIPRLPETLAGGDIDRGLRRLLTAGALGDWEERDRFVSDLMTDDDLLDEDPLPRDPLWSLGAGGLHWAGNLNVFIGDQEVERHMAQSLRVYPGVDNLAMFYVGSGDDEGYSFELRGNVEAWKAGLYHFSTRMFLGHMRSGEAESRRIVENQWGRTHGSLNPVLLRLLPPPKSAQGNVDVYVRQRSTGKEAVIEFGLDPNAEGAGCYTLG